jgi:hypothetical protein
MESEEQKPRNTSEQQNAKPDKEAKKVFINADICGVFSKS